MLWARGRKCNTLDSRSSYLLCQLKATWNISYLHFYSWLCYLLPPSCCWCYQSMHSKHLDRLLPLVWWLCGPTGVCRAAFSTTLGLSIHEESWTSENDILGSIVWNIWKTRNQCVFQQGNFDSCKLVQDIVFFSWLWLKNLISVEVGTFSQWQLNFKTYLNEWRWNLLGS